MNTSPTVPAITPKRAHLEQFFNRVDPVRGRLVFALDATASREPAWAGERPQRTAKLHAAL